MTILDTIFATKRLEVAQHRRLVPLAEIRSRAEKAALPHGFAAALRRPDGRAALRLIAEIKRASPSVGLMVENLDPIRLAVAYRDSGAAAISVLTDESYFQGSLADLEVIAAMPDRPALLRKDFIYDLYQIYEARAAGADAVLLIAASLEQSQLHDLQALAHELSMAALVEVHQESDLDIALSCNPAVIGINNRDLRTFTVDLVTCLKLRPLIPTGIVTVAESGIHTHQDVEFLAQAGFDAVLVGEKLVKAPDANAAIRELMG